jgi:hypothetical protein
VEAPANILPAPRKDAELPDATKPRGPSAPSGLRVSIVMTLDVIPQIAGLLKELNNSDILTHSRQVSNAFDSSIVRWANKRTSLMYQNVIDSGCSTHDLEEVRNRGQESAYFVSPLDKEALLKCLTLRDVRELARFELPAYPSPPPVAERITGGEIDINPGALPRGNLYMATFLAQVLLFFVIMHFGAYVREAVSYATFPTPGTLFGVFSRSRWTLLIFFLAIWSPLFASMGVTVAAVYQKPLLLVCSVLIALRRSLCQRCTAPQIVF